MAFFCCPHRGGTGLEFLGSGQVQALLNLALSLSGFAKYGFEVVGLLNVSI